MHGPFAYIVLRKPRQALLSPTRGIVLHEGACFNRLPALQLWSGILYRATTTKASAMDTHYYLAKSEPETRLEQGVDISFPLSRLASSSTKRTTWEGVRNPIAGKNLKNMKVGDKLLFYHSNCKLPGVAGEVEVCTEPRPDETAWDPVSGRMAKSVAGRWSWGADSCCTYIRWTSVTSIL